MFLALSNNNIPKLPGKPHISVANDDNALIFVDGMYPLQDLNIWLILNVIWLLNSDGGILLFLFNNIDGI